MYFPLLILASTGLDAFEGIPHIVPILIAPGIRPLVHRTWILRGDIPHFSEASRVERYSIYIILIA